MAESESPKPKALPVIRLGLFLMSHSQFLSVVCCTAGILALLLLPILAKNTYISENALMPGSANSMLSKDDVSEGGKFVNKILELASGTSHPGINVPRLIAQHLSDLGIEVSYHKFQTEINSFHPLRFFGSSDPQSIQYNLSCSSYGVNTVGIIRAPRGDGKEAIVLVTPYNSAKITQGEALSLGIVYSLFSLLSRVTWLAKDIIWLAADTQHGEYAAVAAWLGDYHNIVQNLHSEMCRENSLTDLKTSSPLDMDIIPDMFRRAGTLAAGLVIKVVETKAKYEKDSLNIYAEASNGQMPNLDLINIVNYLAVHRQGLQVKIKKVQSLVNSMWLKSLGNLFESVGYMAKSVNPQWGFALPTSEYIEGFSTLISSLYNQALGVPTGPHGAFRDYQVDAITMEISSQLSVRSKFRQNELLWQGGRLIESTIRSVNNLLEKFHQSFFLYLMTSSSKFVSVGVYMIAFALLVAPLPLVAASHFSRASQPTSKDENPTPKPNSLDDLTVMYNKSWKWLNAAKIVFLVHLWGALMIFFPYFYSHIPESSPSSTFSLYAMFLLISIPILFTIFGSFRSRKTEWAYLKSVTIASAFTGLSLMSIINFATAEIGALLLVPICLMTSPLKSRTSTTTTFRTVFEVTSNLGLLLLAFPPVTFLVVKVVLMKEGFEGDGVRMVDEFWYWVEALWEWSSATYVYVCLVHLPCWVLCNLILFHPC